MKRSIITAIFVTQCFLSFSQSDASKFKNEALKNSLFSNKEFKEKFSQYDFSHIFTATNNSYVYGFIGNNFQRIRIKLISIQKDSLLADTYNVYGKSKVNGNIDEFKGTIKISNIRSVKQMYYGVDDEYKNKGIKGIYVIVGDYVLRENNIQEHTGIFKGSFKSGFYLNKKHKVCYDDLHSYADGYSNNEFVGQWICYNHKIVKKCNWGDYRIPYSTGFDIGAGEFSPSDKYLKNGWQSVRDLWSSNKELVDHAKQIENAKWW
ncbi:hypothetical protein FFF34_001795 [Inquilinus sp. KBS0705]|nr:hypothetical protein FFF34_001795 [Inquilinus sp. KBS0705]